MELTKRQTLELLANNIKRKSITKRFTYTTKFKWKCLGCMKDIYIGYTNCSRRSIFCSSCYNKVQLNPTIAQYQYIRKLKETQLNYVTNYINDFLDNQNN